LQRLTLTKRKNQRKKKPVDVPNVKVDEENPVPN